MSTAARLCREIIEEEFGEFPSKVTYQLLIKGRMSLSDLVRFTKLKPRQIRESLVVLIQHGVCYFTEPVQTITTRDPTYYVMDEKKILLRLRMGTILQMTKDMFGKEALEIIKLVFVNGRLSLDALADQMLGVEQDVWASYVKAFTIMANARYLMPVLPEHSRSAVDRLLEAEERETEKYTITTAKDLLAIKLAAVASVESELHVDETVGMKRKAADPLEMMQTKRLALDPLADKAKEEDDLNEVDESVFFTVNYDKYNMLLRNEMIVDFATEKHNRTAGQIIQAFFDHGKKQMKLISEDDTPPATPLHIANLLPVDVAQRNDIVLQHESMSAHQKQTPGLQDIVRAYISLLQADVAGFVKIKDGAGANQYTVNLAKLRTTMKRRVLESLLRERFGVATCRVARILMEKGKLDENQVQKLAMLPPKDTREKLGQLQLQGFVDIQEVPKSADRTPGRSFHLWYISLDKCYEQLLTDVYRTIANLQQRKKHELNQRSALLQKLDREDVRKNFDLLSDHDKAQLDHMNKLIERLETSKTRLDTMIMILRDF